MDFESNLCEAPKNVFGSRGGAPLFLQDSNSLITLTLFRLVIPMQYAMSPVGRRSYCSSVPRARKHVFNQKVKKVVNKREQEDRNKQGLEEVMMVNGTISIARPFPAVLRNAKILMLALLLV